MSKNKILNSKTSSVTTPVVRTPLVHKVEDTNLGLSYGKRRAEPAGLSRRPDQMDYEILDLETGIPIGTIRTDTHSSYVKLLGIVVRSEDGPQWRRVPITKFSSEEDAVQAIKLCIAIAQEGTSP